MKGARSKSRRKSRSNRKRCFKFKSINPIYRLNLDGKVDCINFVNISRHLPAIIKLLINNISPKYNHYYIVCPFYSKYKDFQVGITETMKVKESIKDCILRGVNEEVGLQLLYWSDKNTISIKNNKNWFGVSISKNYKFNPNTFKNDSKDDRQNKTAVVIFDSLKKLLSIYKDIKEGDITSDNITAVGLISVFDCKKIINH
jgi:hypothetical protein